MGYYNDQDPDSESGTKCCGSKFKQLLYWYRQCCKSGSERIRIENVIPDLHGQMRIRIREVKKSRKRTSYLCDFITVRSKVIFLL